MSTAIEDDRTTAGAADHGQPAGEAGSPGETGGTGGAERQVYGAELRERLAADPLADGFVRRLVGALVHVRRYWMFYGVGVAWLLVMALVAPNEDDGLDEFAQARSQFGARSVTGVASSGVVDDTTGADDEATDGGAAFAAAPSPSPASSFSFEPSAPPSSAGASDSSSAPSSSSPSFSSPSFSSPSFGSSTPREDEPEPLKVLTYGYSSATGGTPLDETPEGGIPVGAVFGNERARGFVRLTGEDTTLTLRLHGDGAHEETAAAVLQACPITTAAWSEQKGANLTEGPEYDCTTAAVASRPDDLTFEFDLSTFSDPTGGNGFALVAVIEGSASFHVVLDANS